MIAGQGAKRVRGTYEWAVATVNCSLGCPHDCRYCYARYEKIEKTGMGAAEKWPRVELLHEQRNRSYPLYPGQVMFPSRHDIVPENLDDCLRVLGNLLFAGNRVLVVSKPHLECVRILVKRLVDYRSQLLFRFTITARQPSLLRFWEPGAPLYAERRECLHLVKAKGYATSVSVEPILDMDDVSGMVEELLPLVTDSIWLGKMNKIRRRVCIDSPEIERAVKRIEAGQTDDNIRKLYWRLRDVERVRWKDSIKEVVGLEPAAVPGLDL